MFLTCSKNTLEQIDMINYIVPNEWNNRASVNM